MTIKLNIPADRMSLIDAIGSHRSGPVLFGITIALIAAACAAAGMLSRVLLTLAILTAIVFVLRPVRRNL